VDNAIHAFIIAVLIVQSPYSALLAQHVEGTIYVSACA
jgi:hypothetical protein